MPTKAEQAVINKLDLLQGNVQVVAQDLGLSESWVSRIKLAHWKPVDSTLEVADPDPDQQEHISKLLPTNFNDVVALRDEAVGKLRSLIAEGLIDAKELVRITQVLLKYERDVNSVTAPAIGVFNDNRQVHFNTLVDKMGEMSPEALRALTGVPEPLVISAQTEE